MKNSTRLGFALLLTVTVSQIGCAQALRWYLTPAPFAEHTPPPAPDYADLASWASHPDKTDPADLVPPGTGSVDRQAEAAVDVFFVHPTTYYKSAHFNAPIDDEDANEITDLGVMAGQASTFNGAARIYAPRYRQMAVGGYFTEDKEKGLAFAFTDVERAFDHWLETWSDGRPFLLASHSQGSRHLQTLLAKRFAGEEGAALRERLIAAYLIGGWVDQERLGGELPLPACETATDTGCAIGWRTATEEFEATQTEIVPPDRNLCMNPLTWSRTGAAPKDANLGSIPLAATDRESLPVPDAGLVGARCDAGWLRIDPTPEQDGYDTMVRGGNYHVYDYALFHMNVRANVETRVGAYLSSRPGGGGR